MLKFTFILGDDIQVYMVYIYLLFDVIFIIYFIRFYQHFTRIIKEVFIDFILLLCVIF